MDQNAAPSGAAAAFAGPERRRWNLSYRARLVGGVCGLVLLTGAATTWLAFRSARSSTRALAHSLFREVSAHAVTTTRNFVLRAGPLVESLRHLADQGLALDDSDRLAPQLLAVLQGNPGLSWVSFGDEAGTFTGVYRPAEGGLRINQSRLVDGRSRMVEHDVVPNGAWKESRRDDDSGYDPRARPFYKKAKQEGRLVWLRPYVFYNQGVPGISCAAPVFGKDGKVRGVFSVDFDLNALSDFVTTLSVSERSKFLLFTTDQVLLAHPAQRRAAAAGQRGAGVLLSLKDTGDAVVDAYRAHLPGGLHEGTSSQPFHFFEFRHDGADYLASATTFRVGEDLTWVVGAMAPTDDFLGELWRSQMIALGVAGLGLVVAVLLAALLARRVSKPVLGLIGFMGRVGAGDLDAKADFGGSREFQQLSAALNRMIGELRDGLRLRHALDVAMEVQQRLLPQRPPKVAGLDIAGHSTYCDETGGDYFDFLVIDKAVPGQLLVALGDVMGHGVAAALVMAGARAVLRDRAGAPGGLTELVGHINRLLAADHEGTRFMTMHLAVVDAVAACYRWVSAGHDPAIFYDPATGQFEEIDAGDIPLGIMAEQEYTEHTCGLKSGQVILIGTDGVWEMPNTAGEQFGKDRLREVMRQTAAQSSEQIAQTLRERLMAFRGAMKAVDDVTFVVIKVT